jgi:hypothetical protein
MDYAAGTNRHDEAVLRAVMHNFAQVALWVLSAALWLGVTLLVLCGSGGCCWAARALARHRCCRSAGVVADGGQLRRWFNRRVIGWYAGRKLDLALPVREPNPVLPAHAEYTVVWLHEVGQDYTPAGGGVAAPLPWTGSTLVCHVLAYSRLLRTAACSAAWRWAGRCRCGRGSTCTGLGPPTRTMSRASRPPRVLYATSSRTRCQALWGLYRLRWP